MSLQKTTPGGWRAMALAFGLRWAIKWLLWWPLDWARRQLGQLVQKSLAMALAVMAISVTLAVFTAMMHQETTDLHSLSIRDSAAQRFPQGILRILQDALLHFATLLSFQEPLTIANLLRHRDRLQNLNGANDDLWACLERAIEEFSREPPVVQANARMSIQCAGQALEFLSGRGDCEIAVYMLHYRTQYKVQERTGEMYLARLAVHPRPLSVDDLLAVQRRLQAWGVLTRKLSSCLDFAIQEFAEEPFCVQDDARMVVDCDGQALSFVAGSGGNQINVFDDRDGRFQYRIRVSGVWARAARFLNGNQHAKSRELPWSKFA